MPGRTFTLFAVSGENKSITVKIDEDATIKELRKKVAEAVDVVGENDVRIHYAGKDLRSESSSGQKLTLKDYNFHNEASFFVVMRLPGPPPVVETKKYGPDVQLTDKPDMFTLDDEAGGQRAEMPCGHAISPEPLTAYCRNLLSAGKYEFLCPYKAKPKDPFCNARWELSTVTRLAVLTADEVEEFATKMAENYVRISEGIPSCPRCKGFSVRKNKSDRRVWCLVCKTNTGDRYEFCLSCLKTWLTPQFKDCGNFECCGEESTLNVIKSCNKKKIEEVLCPEIRACPSCGILIEHIGQCKQMVCRCDQKFCFICLKKANDNGRYQCGMWNSICQPAPIQTSIPGC